jgi:hypothetical protein
VPHFDPTLDSKTFLVIEWKGKEASDIIWFEQLATTGGVEENPSPDSEFNPRREQSRHILLH